MDNTNFTKKNDNKYECELCEFYTNKKTDFNIHLKTNKHKTSEFISNNNDFVKKNDRFYCECGKSYKHKPNLYAHKKKCTQTVLLNKDEIDYKEIIKTLLEQNNSLQNTIKDLIPKIGGSINNSNINSNNNNLNICLFLNENCKDALSMDEFVKKIEVSVKDLLLSKEKGIVDGISNLILTHLNKMPLIERPLWCSDKSKKKIFIKDESWEEDLNCEKTGKAIDDVSKLQTKNINKFIIDNPNWMNNEKLKEQYIDIVKKTTEPIHNKKTKIIDNLLDTIYLKDENINQMKLEHAK